MNESRLLAKPRFFYNVENKIFYIIKSLMKFWQGVDIEKINEAIKRKG